MSQLDFHVVVERFHTFQNPTSEHKLDRLIEYCRVADGHRVLDIGCGKAWLLRRMAASHSIDGVGIDIRDAFLDEARGHVAQAPGRGRITLHRMPAGEYRADPHSFDIAICTGASFAIGTFEQLLEWLRPFVKQGGVLAVGDIYARIIPMPLELAAHFGGGAQRSLADTAALLNTDGLTFIGLIDSSIDDWDRYESLHWQAADVWARANPDHPEKESFIARSEMFRRNYVTFGRDALGWGAVRRAGWLRPAVTRGLMASIGHVAIGIAAARAYHEGQLPRWSSLALWSALSLLPDVDVIGFALGVDYAAPWGHRGATHSLTMPAALGLSIGLAARWLHWPGRRTAVVATLVVASHGLLDTMTDGGLGCALFWPFDLTRYFAPWRPIPVAPIGLTFLSPYGVRVAAAELVLFSPILLLALRPLKWPARSVITGVSITLWVALVWLISSGDSIREAVVGFFVREDTAYTTGFTEDAFRNLQPGVSPEDVRHRLGLPFGEDWAYSTESKHLEFDVREPSLGGCRFVRFEHGLVVAAFDLDACERIGIVAGTPPAEVTRLLGWPRESCWRYTWSPRDTHYRMRDVCFLNGRVDHVIREWN